MFFQYSNPACSVLMRALTTALFAAALAQGRAQEQPDGQLLNADSLAVRIAGHVVTEAGAGIREIVVRIEPNRPSGSAGCALKTPRTTDEGRYSSTFFACPPATTYAVTPIGKDDALNGVDVLDVATIAQHVLGLRLLASPYQLIGADVNRSGSVSTLDVATLRRKILQTEEVPDDSASWRFIDRDYVFPVPANPFQQAFPETKIASRSQSADFIGIKIGDVVDDAVFPENKVLVEIGWNAAERLGSKVFVVPVRSASHLPMECLQLGLRFDPAQMAFIGTLPGDLPGWNKDCFGLKRVEQGAIRAMWLPMLPAQEHPVKSGTLLFSIVFRAKQALSEYDLPIALDNAVLQNLALSTAHESHAIQKAPPLAPQAEKPDAEKKVPRLEARCTPNAISDTLRLAIESEAEEPGRVALFNALGQRVFVRDIALTKGTRTFSFAEMAALPRGVYVWKVYGQHEKVQGNVLLE